MLQDKLKAIKSRREQHGKAAMVCDEINNTTALANATVKITLEINSTLKTCLTTLMKQLKFNRETSLKILN